MRLELSSLPREVKGRNGLRWDIAKRLAGWKAVPKPSESEPEDAD